MHNDEGMFIYAFDHKCHLKLEAWKLYARLATDDILLPHVCTLYMKCNLLFIF